MIITSAGLSLVDCSWSNDICKLNNDTRKFDREISSTRQHRQRLNCM